MRAKVWMALWFGFLVVACGSCNVYEAIDVGPEDSPGAGFGTVVGQDEGGVYTRYNIHYISEMGLHRASYANWTQHPGHRVLPYNTKVHALIRDRRIYFFVAETGMRISFEYSAGRMEMSPWEYLDLITSPTPVTYDNLSEIDRQGIAAGRVMTGMSKQGVLVALGYPAKHRTPSLDSNHWVYWKGRHDTYVVQFDSDGNVTRIFD